MYHELASKSLEVEVRYEVIGGVDYPLFFCFCAFCVMAEIISFCKGTRYLGTTIHNRMVIKISYRKTPSIPIQKHSMTILPFTPQNFKLIIGDMIRDKEVFLHFKNTARKSKCPKKSTILVLKNNLVILKWFFWSNKKI